MAVQSYMGGVLFCVGMVAGLVINTLVSNFGNIIYIPAGVGYHPRDLGLNVSTEKGGNWTKSPLIQRAPLSHKELDSLPGRDTVMEFKDTHKHNDDNAVALKLYNQTRIMAWIMTSPENLEKKAKHVKATWAKRFNKAIFVSDKEDKKFPTVGIQVKHGREHLTAKTMKAFDYVYKHHFKDADWFMKADDDTYVIVENLRYFLSSHSPDEPIFFGHHFKVIVKQGYFSGGGGYVLSKEALRRFGNRKPGDCAEDKGAEDVELGRCMEKLGVKTGDSRDSLGRSRFHCFNPETHLHGGYPDWYYQYDKYNAQKGQESISDYAITFHYVSVEQMYNLEFYVYHLRPYGVQSGLQDINKPPSAEATEKRNKENNKLI